MYNQVWAIGKEVTLQEIMDGRENRARYRRMLQDTYNKTVICFTLNIAGPVKVSPLVGEAFILGMGRIRSLLSEAGMHTMLSEMFPHPYGYEAFWVMDDDAMAVKRLMIQAEDTWEMGRLFDIDVFRQDGTKIERTETGEPPRTCMLCDRPAAICARERVHSVAELQEKTFYLIARGIKIRGSFSSQLVGAISRAAMLHEVYTTPKPGLVDLENNGSHKDLNVGLFEKSAAALEIYFANCMDTGEQYCALLQDTLLSRIRPLGMEAERRMFEATGGANTHKGLIFSLGIICTAIGYLKGGRVKISRDNILNVAGDIAAASLSQDFEAAAAHKVRTAGVAQYYEYGISGVRGEAASGFQSVRRIGLPILEQGLKDGLGFYEAGNIALLHLIANVTDTNMISRVGRVQARALQDEIASRLEGGPPIDTKYLKKLDSRFIELNASPGGCADLLAISYFMHMLGDILR